MLYPEEVVFNEIKWEYDWPDWWIHWLIRKHKMDGTYRQLCEALKKRGELVCME